MKIVIPGGSGQVGTVLARAFHAAGDEVILLSRSPALAPWRVVSWDPPSIGPWAEELNDADVVINLAGRNVNCRYTAASRREIMESRVASTVAVGAAIERAARPPALWLQASTATIYAHRFDASNDEATGQIGGHEPGAPASWHFSIEVAQNWERACNAARVPHTRRVLMRSAVIMSPDRGGIFDTLLSLVRGGLGGRAGNGRQYVSWIHDADFIRVIDHLLLREHFDGTVNLASPGPISNSVFMRILRGAWGGRVALPVTRPTLEIGAFLLRTESELVLKSRRVVPRRLLDDGFAFQFPHWDDAARDLVARWRNQRVASRH